MAADPCGRNDVAWKSAPQHLSPGALRCAHAIGHAAGFHGNAEVFVGVHAGAGPACWPRAGTFYRSFAEASQHCRRNAGCCRTVWRRLVSGDPPIPQSKSPFGGGPDIYTPKSITEQGGASTASRSADTALLFSRH